MNDDVKALIALCVVASVVAGTTLVYVLWKDNESSLSSAGSLATFSSYAELEKFIDIKRGDETYQYETTDRLLLRDVESDSSGSYSTTNVQVYGVDEADTVKTDGEHIFIARGGSVMVVAAHPEDSMETIAVIKASEILGYEQGEARLTVSGVYLWKDKLVVMADVYEYDEILDLWAYVLPITRSVNCHRAIASVFDIADPSDPQLESSRGVSGSHLATRMIGSVVYSVAQWGILNVDGNVLIPKAWDKQSHEDIGARKIHYDGETRSADAFVSLMAFDVSDGRHREASVITGYASTVYMSLNALYLTYQKWTGAAAWVDDSFAPEDESTTRTTIHKVEVDGLTMRPVATGEVAGWLLNQFSMDEKDGTLRVTTTTSWISPKNNVYVLGADMVIIGSLEGLAPTERIYASRFVGDTLYLVTFKQVDPLFVIDLSVPSAPVVLGELTIPGFSSYLHPISDGYVLGIGSQDGHVKLSVFDVSNPANPSEVDSYVVDNKSRTSVVYEHKALLYDPARALLVIPITTYDYTTTYTRETKAWVFNVSTEDGISLWGTIAYEETNYYYLNAERSLYIGDTLYTISYASITASSLYDLSEMGTLTFYCEPEYLDYPYYR